jgi:hypothetical protein
LLDNDPSRDQTPDQIEGYLRSREVGDTVAIRSTQNHMLDFHVAEVTGIKRGRLYTDNAGSTGGLAWHLKSGKNCFHPKGQSTLVIPTDAVRAFIERHPRGLWMLAS